MKINRLNSQETTQPVGDLRNNTGQGCKRSCGSNPPSPDTQTQKGEGK